LAGGGTVKEGTILARSTADGTFIPFAKGGSTNGNGIACVVLPYTVEVPADSGEVSVQALTAGLIDPRKLVVHTDGDNQNVDGSVLDQLRARSIRPVTVQQLDRFDNPNNSNG